MLKIEFPVTEPTYFCAFPSDNTFLHYGKLMSINCMGTGQQNCEDFTDQAEWIRRCADFGVTIDPTTDFEEEVRS